MTTAPQLRITRGHPTDDELAALVTALCALRNHDTPGPRPAPVPAWAPWLRSATYHPPGAWTSPRARTGA